MKHTNITNADIVKGMSDELKHKMATNMNNRKNILGELRGKKKQLNTEYKPRQYNEQDMEKILKGV